MKKLNFEIKVECKGSAVGTLGWLNEKLAKIELVIKNTQNGEVGMFAKELVGLTDEGKKRYVNSFICKVRGFDSNDSSRWTNGYCKISDTELVVTNLYSDEVSFGFVDTPLTKAAERVAEEFLTMACEKFVEWWENDGVLEN